MLTLVDWLLNLFRNQNAAQQFVLAPEQAMRDAGLSGITPAQLTAVASTAMPGLALGSDPVAGLQRAVANNYGYNDYTPYSSHYAPSYSQGYDYSPSIASPSLLSPSWAPQNTFAPDTDLASNNRTDLMSHNQTPIMSPVQSSGANSQQGGFNLGFGDITLGDKTSNTASNGGVVVGGENRGDIVSGDGAVLGDGNSVTNGDVVAGSGATVNQGEGTVTNVGSTTNTGSGSVIRDNDAPVFQDVDASGGNGGHAGGGSGGLLDVGIGNRTDGGDAGGGGITVITKDTGNSSSSSQSHTVTETRTTTLVNDNSDNVNYTGNTSNHTLVDNDNHSLLSNSGSQSLLGNSGGESMFGTTGDHSLFGNSGGESVFGADTTVDNQAAVTAPGHHGLLGF
ncbi:IniB N-terminal domain-containing protein [Mycolicibacterium brumae]|uniref:IniB N-terminal domain-containing protein n=1 Tax=Mycolicibacterium brumae TaxID=85968 RepID=UPI000A8E4C7B|nr:IniB N-terminal domain-containing protein [Mycolicibacterium brumae]RWA18370.1 hypothetical protein MBRU_03925 [Mycolicibacterium brumae DSM 44177]UWW10408.1 IniB N-terminal domain-containing protein [Mycolicibacterium brumae]